MQFFKQLFIFVGILLAANCPAQEHSQKNTVFVERIESGPDLYRYLASTNNVDIPWRGVVLDKEGITLAFQGECNYYTFRNGQKLTLDEIFYTRAMAYNVGNGLADRYKRDIEAFTTETWKLEIADAQRIKISQDEYILLMFAKNGQVTTPLQRHYCYIFRLDKGIAVSVLGFIHYSDESVTLPDMTATSGKLLLTCTYYKAGINGKPEEDTYIITHDNDGHWVMR